VLLELLTRWQKIDPEGAEKVAKFIERAREFVEGRHFPFTVIVDDPAGNSFVQNPSGTSAPNPTSTLPLLRALSVTADRLAPKSDPNLKLTKYFRTHEQDVALGLVLLSFGSYFSCIDCFFFSHYPSRDENR
jgi:hypothetical protein